jgi:biopolymer transport protein ExbD
MSIAFRKGNADIQGNLTPMIDMAFLLIVFFVLVSRIVDRDRVDMDLPSPTESATERASEDRRVVINVLPGEGGKADGYRVGGVEFSSSAAGVASMTQHLAGLFAANPQIHVNVRADRATHYQFVEPVMNAVSAGARRAGNAPGAARVNLMVVKP